jgi:putative membrane protein
MLWVKSFHIIFIASWFAGLFYLPRLFVNLADVGDTQSKEYQRLLGMAQRLYRFMTVLAIPALALGLWLWLGYGIGRGGGAYWMHAKLLVVGVLLVYHGHCRYLLTQFEQFCNQRSHVWYRWFNEIPVLLLVVAVLLVVLKPF